MKVSELEGAQLDYWVAKAAGYATEHVNIGEGWVVVPPGGAAYVTGLPLTNPMHWAPSQDWAQGGPIIERERIDLSNLGEFGWQAWHNPDASSHYCLQVAEGPTPLIAAMRAFVASRFGEEVPQ